ncbi:MAG: HU family DNA-binding protein [Methylotenera sp.]|nr:HU family DNA-binding protein [Methylotenera sp.]
MNQAELINAVTQKVGLPKVQIESTLKELGAVITEQLKTGGEVTLPGLGKLSVKTRAARTGRNPSTGAALAIPEKNVPHFSALKALKDAVTG